MIRNGDRVEYVFFIIADGYIVNRKRDGQRP